MGTAHILQGASFVTRYRGRTDITRRKISDGKQNERSSAQDLANTLRQTQSRETKPQEIASLEKIIRLEYDNYFNSTSGPYFHIDHTDLCIGVVQTTNGKSSKIVCSSLVGGRDPVNKGIRKGSLNRALCIMLRNVTERVAF